MCPGATLYRGREPAGTWGPCSAYDGTGLKQLASNQANPFRIAVDDTKAYWTSRLAGAVLVVDKTGAGAPTVFASANKPSGISVDSSNVYWASDTDAAVYRQSKAGGATTLLASIAGVPGPPAPTGLLGVTDMVGTTTTLFLSDGRSLAKIDKGTGKVTFINPNITGAYWSATVSLTGLLANMYSSSPTTDYLQIEGAEDSTEVGDGTLNEAIGSMVTDGCTFYFDRTTQIKRIRLGSMEFSARGAAIATTVFSGTTAVRRLALDSNTLYWTDTGYVGKVAR